MDLGTIREVEFGFVENVICITTQRGLPSAVLQFMRASADFSPVLVCVIPRLIETQKRTLRKTNSMTKTDQIVTARKYAIGLVEL